MAMRNFSKNFLLVFFVVLLNQACIENICAASNPLLSNITNQVEDLDIQRMWRIISAIAKNCGQPALDDLMERMLTKEELYGLKVDGSITFACFVKSIKWDALFKLINSGVKVEDSTFVCVKVGTERNNEITAALRQICQQNVGKLLIVRLLIALKRNFQNVSSYTLYLEEGPLCHVYQHYVKGARVNDNIQKRSDKNRRNTNYSVITLNLDLLKEIRYTLFCDSSISDSILMSDDSYPEFDNIDVALFHEMVHVFHLFTPADEDDDIAVSSKHSIYLAGQDDDGSYNIALHKLFRYYYKHFIDLRSRIKDEALLCAHLMPWHNFTNENCYRVNFEEMLTIAGLPPDAEGYQPGDELSENLYRAERGLPLRFGHKLFTYYESGKIYEKVKSCVQDTLNKFELAYEDTFPKQTERYEQKARMSKQEGFAGMYYFTIDPEFRQLSVKEKFKPPLNTLTDKIGKEESIYYYLRSEYNEWVFKRFKFD